MPQQAGDLVCTYAHKFGVARYTKYQLMFEYSQNNIQKFIKPVKELSKVSCKNF